MKKKINLPKIKVLRYFDQKKIGSIPRIFISSIMLIFFFYSAPEILIMQIKMIMSTKITQKKF